MPEKPSNPDRKAMSYIALGGFILVAGSAGAAYEAFSNEYIQAGGLGVLALAGGGMAAYEGIRMASKQWVRNNHDLLKYDRTNETIDD